MMADSPDYGKQSNGNSDEEHDEETNVKSGEGDSPTSQPNLVTLSIEQLKQLLNDNKSTVDLKPCQEQEGCQESDYECDDEEPLSSDDDTEMLADPIDSKLAAYIDSRLTEEQSSEKLKLKFQKASRPENVNFSKEVKIDKILFNSLSFTAKKRDLNLKKIQNMTVKAVNNVAKVADLLVKKCRSKGKVTFTEAECREMHSHTVNGLGLMCQTSHRINSRKVSFLSSVDIWACYVGLSKHKIA